MNFESKLQISEIKVGEVPDIDLSQLGVVNYGNFTVEVVDPVADYLNLMEVSYKEVLDRFFVVVILLTIILFSECL